MDSGNLAGHLVVLRSGLMEMDSHKIVSPGVFDGLSDTLEVLRQSVAEIEKNRKSPARELLREISAKMKQIQEKRKTSPVCLSEIHTLLRQLSTDVSKALSGLDPKRSEKIKKWGRAFEQQCYDFLEDMSFIAPWILLAPEVPGIWDSKMKTTGTT